jgi:hypothetical protein
MTAILDLGLVALLCAMAFAAGLAIGFLATAYVIFAEATEDLRRGP